MKNLTLEYMDKLEEEFARNNYNGIKTEEESFKILKGSVPVLVSGAHSIDQIRDGMLKPRELYSGALCKLIHEYTDCHVIYKYHNDGIDDNFILHTKYKENIGRIIKENDIKLVIDIHGMVGSKSKRYRGYDVELGTDSGRNLLGNTDVSDCMVKVLNKHGVEQVVVDKKFKASRKRTISKYISTNFKTPAIQVEISGDYRNAVDYGVENIKKLLDSFKEIISVI